MGPSSYSYSRREEIEIRKPQWSKIAADFKCAESLINAFNKSWHGRYAPLFEVTSAVQDLAGKLSACGWSFGSAENGKREASHKWLSGVTTQVDRAGGDGDHATAWAFIMNRAADKRVLKKKIVEEVAEALQSLGEERAE